jgi:hypothetical protein
MDWNEFIEDIYKQLMKGVPLIPEEKAMGICGRYKEVIYSYNECAYSPCSSCVYFMNDPEGVKL